MAVMWMRNPVDTFILLSTIIVMPGYFYFVMARVRPMIVKEFQMSEWEHGIHALLATWCFVNTVGNLFLCVLTNTSSRRTTKLRNLYSGRYCKECKITQPPKSWHCKRCNVCILRRDHHCYLFSSCIGAYNFRYFFLCTLHTMTSVMYSSYFVFHYIMLKFGNKGVWLTVFGTINPVLRFYTKEWFSMKDLYVVFFLLNLAMIGVSGCFFCFHLKNMLMGVTSVETKPLDWKEVRVNWKRNVVNVLGEKWYLTLFWPFVHSPLPDVIN